VADEQAKKIIKDEKKKAKDQKDVQAMLDDVCLEEADKKQPQENSSEASGSVMSEDQ
jgi:hypothetical protein